VPDAGADGAQAELFLQRGRSEQRDYSGGRYLCRAWHRAPRRVWREDTVKLMAYR